MYVLRLVEFSSDNILHIFDFKSWCYSGGCVVMFALLSVNNYRISTIHFQMKWRSKSSIFLIHLIWILIFVRTRVIWIELFVHGVGQRLTENDMVLLLARALPSKVISKQSSSNIYESMYLTYSPNSIENFVQNIPAHTQLHFISRLVQKFIFECE